MPIFNFKKLVRDNIWKWHEESGHTVYGRKLAGTDLIIALREKLREEAEEVYEAKTKDELTEEIADVVEVVSALSKAAEIDSEEIERIRVDKAKRKGAFSLAEYIESVEMPNEDDKWVRYCREAPNKYPEIGVVKDVPSIENGSYMHSKSGKLYTVMGVAMHTETEEMLVVYKPQYDTPYELFTRPLAMFTEQVKVDGKIVPRFQKLK